MTISNNNTIVVEKIASPTNLIELKKYNIKMLELSE